MNDRENVSASREFEWLLCSLDETIRLLRSGLQECITLLNPDDGPGSTLPLSTSRSEALKGVVTRSGCCITRGDMQVKMAGLPHTKGLQAYKITLSPPTSSPPAPAASGPASRPESDTDLHLPHSTIVLEQLVDVTNFVSACLALLDSVPLVEGEEGSMFDRGTMDSKCIVDMLNSLHSNVLAARSALKEPAPHRLFPFHSVDSNIFDSSLPSSLAFNIYISEAALVAELRTLDSLPSLDLNKSSFSLKALDIPSPFGFKKRFATAVGLRGGSADQTQHNAESNPEELVVYKDTDVRVREIVRVESQDPKLMAAWAKLCGLEHVLSTTVKSLRLLMLAAGTEC